MRTLPAIAALLLACGPSTFDAGSSVDDCVGGKCDSPNTTICEASLVQQGRTAAQAARECGLQMCEERRGLVLDSLKVAFTHDAVRWSCADVRGVNQMFRDDRGQEYCEYFAIVKLPVTGDPRSDQRPGVAHSIVLGQETSDEALTLTRPQIDMLDRLGNQEVGRCVFTSWHHDVAGPVPACAGAGGCPKVLDEPVSTKVFRMTGSFNSNGAARDLVEKCLVTRGDQSIKDDFVRGCMITQKLFNTEWRKSDPAICAAAMRLDECGCSLPGAQGASSIAASLITAQPSAEGRGTDVTLRGFPLGGWSGLDALPPGCTHVDIGLEKGGAPSRTVVSCPISASDILSGAADLKGLCREKYGEDVVVHVPIPAAQITCSPPSLSTCGPSPWIVGGGS